MARITCLAFMALVIALFDISTGEERDCVRNARNSLVPLIANSSPEELDHLEALYGFSLSDSSDVEVIFCAIFESSPSEAARTLFAGGYVTAFMRYIYGIETAGLIYAKSQGDINSYMNALNSKGYFQIDPQVTTLALEWMFDISPEEAVQLVASVPQVPYSEGCQQFADALEDFQSEEEERWNEFSESAADMTGLDPTDTETYGAFLCRLAEANSFQEMAVLTMADGTIENVIRFLSINGFSRLF